MAEFTLKKREVETLKLNIGEESFEIPLLNSLTLAEAAEAKTAEGVEAFFRKYIKAEVADALTIGNWKDISTAWTEASRGATGDLTPGE